MAYNSLQEKCKVIHSSIMPHLYIADAHYMLITGKIRENLLKFRYMTRIDQI